MADANIELDKCLEKVSLLKKEHLDFIRTLKRPTDNIIIVLAAVVILCKDIIVAKPGG